MSEPEKPLSDANGPAQIVPLDGLRAVAVTLVILTHLSSRLFPGGNVGVDIFFVLSGFLITSVLLREQNKTGSISLWAFYIRRALRLMPALVVMVIGDALLNVFLGVRADHPWLDAIAALTYTMDFLRSLGGHTDWTTLGHTWSLSVEEQFYLLWPWALLLMLRFRSRFNLPILVIVIGLVAVWRLYLLTTGHSSDRVYYAFDTRLDQLLIGCAVAIGLSQSSRFTIAPILARLWPLALLVIGIVTVRGNPQEEVSASLTLTLVGICAAILVLNLSLFPKGILGKILSWPIAVALGRISYGIYLWHFTLIVHIRIGDQPQIKGIIAVALSVLAAIASFYCVERPFLKLKARFERREGRVDPLAGEVAATS